MRNLRNNTAHRRGILARNLLVKLCDAEALNDVFLLLSVADRAAIVLDRDAPAFIFRFLCHLSISDCGSRIADFSFRSEFATSIRIRTRTKSAIRNPNPQLREFLNLLAAKSCNLERIFHPHQTVERRANDIVIIRGSEDLRPDIVNTQ